MTLGDRNAIEHLVLLEDGADLDWLLEETTTEFDLVRNTAAIHLNLHEMCFLLFERGFPDLGVGEDADDGAVFLDSLQLASDR